MHQHYVSRARGKEGQAISRWPLEYLCAITLLPLRHLDSAPNFALSTTMPLPYDLTTTAAIPVTHSYGSLKPETFQTFLLVKPVSRLVAMNIARLWSLDVKISSLDLVVPTDELMETCLT